MSSYFDPTNKDNKIVLDYFENKKWLIVEPSLSVRASLKKTLLQIGSKQLNMIDTDSVKSAIELVKLHKPDFVLTNRFPEDSKFRDIFFEHLQSNPNRLKSGFFVITEENSMSEVAQTLNYEMDGIISFPFTGASVISSILVGIKQKIDPNPYLVKLNNGKEQFILDNIDFAESFFEEAIKLEKSPFEAFYYMGEINKKKNEIDLAISFYERALYINSNHYRTLLNLTRLYYQTNNHALAYETSVNLVKRFPTPPEIIPTLVKLSIINKRYEDIINYFKIFSKIENPNPEIQTSISAGLAILGIFFSKNSNIDKARDSLCLSLRFSNGKLSIIDSIVTTFEKINMLDIFIKEFESLDVAKWPPAASGYYFHAINLTRANHQEVLGIGDKLLRNKIKNILIDRGMIQRGILAKRKLGIIEGQILEAISKYPENKHEFEDMLKLAKNELT